MKIFFGTGTISSLDTSTLFVFHTMADNISEGVAVTDEHDNLVYLNSSGRKIFGIKVFGQSIQDIIDFFEIFDLEKRPLSPPETPSGRALAGEAVDNLELAVRTPKAEKVLSFRSLPITSSTGKIQGSILIFSDITDIKKLITSDLKRKRELVLNRIGRVCNSTLSIDEVLVKIAQSIEEAIDCDFVSILSPSEEFWTLWTAGGLSPLNDSNPVPLEDFQTGLRAMKSKKPIRLIAVKNGDSGLKKIAGNRHVGSCVIYPIILSGKSNGVIAINFSRGDRELSKEDFSLLSGVSQHIAIAMEKTRLFEEQARKSSELEVINLMGNEIVRGIELEEFLSQAAKILSKLIPSDGGAIFVYNDIFKRITHSQFNLIGPELQSSLTKEDGMIYKMVRRKSSVLIENESRMRGADIDLHEHGVLSFIGVPLVFEEKVTGALCLIGKKKEHQFERHDVELLQNIGRSVSVALKNSELFEEHKDISRTLQMSLLPSEIPEIEGLDVGIFYESATRRAMIGGDFYDFFKVSEDEYGIVVGDISGKGIEAAADSTLVKNILKGFAIEGYVLGDVMKHLNRWVSRQIAVDKFATMIYAVYNKALSTIVYANAGHPYPLIYGARKGFIRDSDLAIGIDPDQNFKLFSFRVEPSEIIIFYTDGLIEARRNKEIFGENRLIRSVKEIAHLSAQEIADNLSKRAAEFTGKEFRDDILMMVFKKK